MTRSMHAKQVNLDLLFDADAWHRTCECPWTFFAFPTSCATANGFPSDTVACEFLAEIQSNGMDVAIWVHPSDANTRYFVCKIADIQRLNAVIAKLEEDSRFGKDFCLKQTEHLFAEA